MQLRVKVIAILVCMVSLYGGLDFVIQRFFILPSFRALERDSAERDLQRCLDAIQREIYHLDRFCNDWSEWDDTVQFVSGSRPAFVEENLNPKSYAEENQIHLMAFFDAAGALVWGEGYDTVAEEPLSFLSLFPEGWPPDHPLLSHPLDGRKSMGLVMSARGPALIVSRPITPSFAQEPVAGTVAMFRIFGEELAAVLREQTKVDFELWVLGGAPLPAEVAAAMDGMAGNPPRHVQYNGLDSLLIYTTYPDVGGRPALVLRASVPRDILRKGLDALELDAYAAVCAGMLTLLIVILLMRRAVTEPLARLMAHVRGIRKEDQLTLIEMPERHDEFGELALEFNAMIQRLLLDMEARRQAQSALRDSEEKLRALFDTAPDGIFTTGPGGVILSANAAAAAMFGESEAALAGRPLSALAASEERDALEAGMERLLATGEDGSFASGQEIRGIRAGGVSLALHVRMSRVVLGDTAQLTVMMRDITELKAMSERVARSRHLAQIGEMGASVAHEIRNPLAGISGSAQVLARELPEAHRHREILEEMIHQIGRVEQTVRHLLDFAKEWRPARSRVGLGNLARQVVRDAQGNGLLNGVHVVTTGLDDSSAEVLADPMQVQQVLLNVLSNAVHAMPDGGEIRMAITEQGGEVALRVSDTGCGMTPEQREQALRPFFTTKVHGVGLGLAVCQRIMEAHGGRIEIDSAPGQGAVISFFFPMEA